MQFLAIVHQTAVLLLLLCTFLFHRHLKQIKREREFSSSEFMMYIVTQVSYLLWAASYLILILARN